MLHRRSASASVRPLPFSTGSTYGHQSGRTSTPRHSARSRSWALVELQALLHSPSSPRIERLPPPSPPCSALASSLKRWSPILFRLPGAEPPGRLSARAGSRLPRTCRAQRRKGVNATVGSAAACSSGGGPPTAAPRQRA